MILLSTEVFQLELLRVSRNLALDAVSRLAQAQFLDGLDLLGEGLLHAPAQVLEFDELLLQFRFVLEPQGGVLFDIPCGQKYIATWNYGSTIPFNWDSPYNIAYLSSATPLGLFYPTFPIQKWRSCSL